MHAAVDLFEPLAGQRPVGCPAEDIPRRAGLAVDHAAVLLDKCQLPFAHPAVERRRSRDDPGFVDCFAVQRRAHIALAEYHHGHPAQPVMDQPLVL
jgi:hypothetical protein